MNIPKTARRLKQFMEATEQQIVEKFLSIPGALELTTYDKSKPCVYIPGDREDRVLLVAHYDTVFSKPAQVDQIGTILLSGQQGVGIGADDRAGCCALWMLRNLGHSILIVPDEEVGCVGSIYAAKHYSDLLEDHSLMIEFDRAGNSDLVYYDMETVEFQRYMEEAFPGYKYATGSFTDIAELAPALDVAAVNISIGYYNQHTSSECMDVTEFIRTVYLAMQFLRRDKIESFKPDPDSWRSSYSYGSYYDNRWNSYDYGYDRHDDEDVPFEQGEDDEASLKICELEEADVIVCPRCGFEHTDTYTDMILEDFDHAYCGNCNNYFSPLDHCYMWETEDEIEDDETNTYEVTT